jgi:uncharacterized membrane protein
MTRIAYRKDASSLLKQLGWWCFFVLCTIYGLYALNLGVVEILSQLGFAADVKYRAAPFMFIVHAFSGSAALISGSLQFNRTLLIHRRELHRFLGRVYVAAIWVSSAAALWNAVFFDVTLPAKFAFGVLAVLWFSTTTAAFLHIRRRETKEHREWMIRSFSLSFFFVTGGFWMPGLASTGLPEEIAYPLAVLLGWALNLVFAELWIRQTRKNLTERELRRLREG